jgi:aspartate racemase
MANKVLGVLGGMGALASAQFVSTLYRLNPAPTEQEQPVVLLHSNPQLPDRTRALFEGRRAELAAALGHDLTQLMDAGADLMVICCVTAHAVWDELPQPARARTVSLLNTLFASPDLKARRRLVLCTEATRRLGLLQDHPSFAAHRDQLIFADEAGQAAIHKIVYELKRGAPSALVLPTLVALARDAGAQGFIAACTEMHLLGDLPDGLDLLDPLHIIARDLPRLLA